MIDLSAEERARRSLGRLMFIARWIMVPVYLGLLGALALVAVKFVQRLVEVVPTLLQQESTETIISALSLVDLSLVGNLIVIIIFAGWQNFVGRFQSTSPGEQPDPFSSLGFGAIKLRLMASIVVIAAILMLETFVHFDETQKGTAIWQLVMLLGFAATGVLLAAMDRIGGDH